MQPSVASHYKSYIQSYTKYKATHDIKVKDAISAFSPLQGNVKHWSGEVENYSILIAYFR